MIGQQGTGNGQLHITQNFTLHYHIVICIKQDQAEDGIPFKLKDYLELVDWAGRAIKENKRG